MITKVTINNNKNTPLHYLPSIFDNGRVFTFRSGVNILVGENGSGKTTLLKLIEKYLLINKDEQSRKHLSSLFDITKEEIKDGVDVKSDYMLKTFRFCRIEEMKEEDERALGNVSNFTMLLECNTSSEGEGVVVALNSLWGRVFGVDLKSPMLAMKSEAKNNERVKQYMQYVKRNAIPYDENYEVTILLDEPDRNLDVFNIRHIYNILAEPKEHTQLIAVVHNPLLIYRISNVENVNIIELTEGYVEKIKKEVEKYVKTP